MGLRQIAKEAIERITGDTDGWATEITFTSPANDTASITGLASLIHLAVDEEGKAVNSKKSHVSVAEKALTDLSYPVRNADGDVAIMGHKVDVADSTGVIKHYVIIEIFPDRTVGLITCILGDFKE